MYDDDDDITFVTKPSVMTLNSGDIDLEVKDDSLIYVRSPSHSYH